ncbi:MAG: phage holin family protein [Actinomycetes bacterium]
MATTNGTPKRDDRASMGQLVSSLAQQVSTLVREEIELAKAEMSASAKRGATGAGLLAVTVALLTMTGILVTWAAVYGLSDGTGLPLWASFLIVAAVYLVVAVIIAFIAVRQLKKARGPEQAQAAAEETKQILTGLKPKPPVPAAPGSTPGSAPESTPEPETGSAEPVTSPTPPAGP